MRRLRSDSGAWAIWLAVTASAAAGVAIGVFSPPVMEELTTKDGAAGALVVATLLVVIVSVWALHRDRFHPLGLPTVYVSLVCVAPLLYIDVTGRPLASLSAADLTPAFRAVFVATLISIPIGIWLGLWLMRRELPAVEKRRVDWNVVLRVGRTVLGAALLLRIGDFVTSYGSAYGTGAVTFGVQGLIETAANIGSLGAIVLICVSHVNLSHPALRPLDVFLGGIFVFVTLASGSRGELIAPIVFILLIQHTYVRPLSTKALASALVLLVVVFQGVGGARANEEFFAGRDLAADRVLVGLSVPAQVQGLLMRYVPDREPLRLGSTYFAALQRQLPGPIALAILGPPTDTASFELRQMLGFYDPGAGFGFSLPAEGFLNFGLIGVVGACLVTGFLLGGSYARRPAGLPDRALHVLYPLLVASLPLSLRADAVQQIKTVLYPMVFAAVVFALARQGDEPEPVRWSPSCSNDCVPRVAGSRKRLDGAEFGRQTSAT